MYGNNDTYIHNKVLDFVSLYNYKTNSQSLQLDWNLDQYKMALDGGFSQWEDPGTRSMDLQ